MRLPPAGGSGGAKPPVGVRLARLAGSCLLACLVAGAADAQPRIPGVPSGSNAQQGQMLLQADSLVYDNDRQVVVAEGGVQIFYNGNTIQAQRVLYNRQTRRLTAEGGVRLVDTQGNVTTASSIDLSEDLRDGFVRTLRLYQPRDRTRFSADSTERRPNDVTVFERGTYTACEPCRDRPERPPLWQVRAARIIHNQQEQRLYYENGFLEFFGIPVAYVPYFWSPDGTVQRSSGFLSPQIQRSSRTGSGYGIPYYFALSPFYDLTVTPTYYTRQGLHMSADWRHALPFGNYRIRLSGINQQDPDSVGALGDVGRRDWRGGIESWGEFRITDRWRFGWNVAADSDQRYFQDYMEYPLSRTERISDVYLTGQGTRSYFDAHVYHVRSYVVGSPTTDRQSFMPWVAPVTDYQTAIADPIVGGEFRLSTNVTHISRSDAMSFAFVNENGQLQRYLTPGFAGDYTRFSINTQWRRTFTDPLGQRWTPFFGLRADVYDVNPQDEVYSTVTVGGALNGTSSFEAARNILPQFFNQNNAGFRAMPMAGLDYRYPFIGTAFGATHIIEPIAQIIVRPNETRIGQLPNEDAQSLVFDDTNLFAPSRFSGYDRVEGGTRANVGLQYTFQSPTGFLLSALFGQSYHLAGLNSFANGGQDLTGVGLNSGLDTRRSDYVAGLRVQPWAHGDITARFRFDETTFNVQRMDISGAVYYGPVSASAAYTRIAAQPDLGYTTDREHITVSGQYRLDTNWSLNAAGSYSLQNSTGQSGWVSNQIGLRYVDDCLVFNLDYTNVYSGFGDVQPHQRVVARITLRTLGGVTVGTSLNSN
jgi:LPS-assembly protein